MKKKKCDTCGGAGLIDVMDETGNVVSQKQCPHVAEYAKKATKKPKEPTFLREPEQVKSLVESALEKIRQKVERKTGEGSEQPG